MRRYSRLWVGYHLPGHHAIRLSVMVEMLTVDIDSRWKSQFVGLRARGVRNSCQCPICRFSLEHTSSVRTLWAKAALTNRLLWQSMIPSMYPSWTGKIETACCPGQFTGWQQLSVCSVRVTVLTIMRTTLCWFWCCLKFSCECCWSKSMGGQYLIFRLPSEKISWVQMLWEKGSIPNKRCICFS